MDWVSQWSDNKKARANQQEASEISQNSQDLNQHWEDMDDLTPWALDEIRRLKPRLDHSTKPHSGTKKTLGIWFSNLLFSPVGLSLALLLVASLFASLNGYWPPGTQAVSYITAPGEQRQIILPDGSLLHLNTASSVLLGYQDATRVLEFEKGEVLIDVVENPSRPFVLRVLENELFTLGARFNLRIRNAEVTLVVAEGQVVVLPSQMAVEEYLAATRENDSPIDPLLVTQGYGLHIDADGNIAAPQAVQVESVIAWDRGLLIFDKVPLRQVAAEVSGYMLTDIRVATAVKDRLISGEIPIRDQETMLRHLSELAELESVQKSAEIALLFQPAVTPAK